MPVMSGGSWEAMTTAERLDRVALAAELHQLAVGFQAESLQLAGQDPTGARRCFDVSRTLWRQRDVLDDLTLTPDLVRARGLADAATVILAQLEGARRFLRAARAVDAYLTRAEARR